MPLTLTYGAGGRRIQRSPGSAQNRQNTKHMQGGRVAKKSRDGALCQNGDRPPSADIFATLSGQACDYNPFLGLTPQALTVPGPVCVLCFARTASAASKRAYLLRELPRTRVRGRGPANSKVAGLSPEQYKTQNTCRAGGWRERAATAPCAKMATGRRRRVSHPTRSFMRLLTFQARHLTH